MYGLTNSTMINQMLKDPWTYICTIFMGFVQWVIIHSNAIMGLIVFVGGVVTFIYGMIEKTKKNRICDLEKKQMEEMHRIELEIKQEQLKRLKSNQ